jgi:hypothetical protein
MLMIALFNHMLCIVQPVPVSIESRRGQMTVALSQSAVSGVGGQELYDLFPTTTEVQLSVQENLCRLAKITRLRELHG